MLPSLVHKPTSLTGNGGRVLVTQVHIQSAVPHGPPALHHQGGSGSAPLTRKEHDLRRDNGGTGGLLARTDTQISGRPAWCDQSDGMRVCGSLSDSTLYVLQDWKV